MSEAYLQPRGAVRQAPPAFVAAPVARGFTLVELMVATLLMTILTGSVVFIFMRAQQIFTRVDAKVQVYQYARFAFDQMERDLANVVRTRDMEFFNDAAPPSGRKGRYDGGEEIPIRGTANLDGDQLNGDSIYNYSVTLRQPDPYTDWQGQYKHRWDSVYFKTVTVVNGQTTGALVEYAVADTDKERPRLVRKLWRVTGVDNGNPLAPRYEVNGNAQAQPKTQDLCLYAVDCKFEIFVKNRRRRHPGDWYECEELVTPPRRIDNNREVFEPFHNYWRPPNLMIQTYYDQNHNDALLNADIGVVRKGTGGLPTLFNTPNDFTFPMLREGDRIYLSKIGGGGGSIKAKDYTIKAFHRKRSPGNTLEPWDPDAPANELRIEFEERLEFPANVSAVNVTYAAAWLPPALRATLQIKDSKSLQIRSVSRVFKILSS